MNDTSGADSTGAISPGQLLRNARKAAKLDVRTVADTLHLLPRQIEALEQDHYAMFSADIFCKGYIRSYGKLLGLDTDELLASYEQQCPADTWPVEDLKIAAPRAQLQRSQRWMYSISTAALLAVISLLWLANPDAAESPATLPVAESKIVIDDRDTSLLTTLSDAEQRPQSAAQIGLALSDGASSPETPPAVAPVVPVRIVDSAVVDTAVADSTTSQQQSKTLTASRPSEDNFASTGDSLLTFQFSGDCWVQVKDSNDQVLYADLKRAQDTLNLSGSAPFNVVLGYAPAVSLALNGEPVTIAINRKNNAANFTVGNL